MRSYCNFFLESRKGEFLFKTVVFHLHSFSRAVKSIHNDIFETTALFGTSMWVILYGLRMCRCNNSLAEFIIQALFFSSLPSIGFLYRVNHLHGQYFNVGFWILLWICYSQQKCRENFFSIASLKPIKTLPQNISHSLLLTCFIFGWSQSCALR